MMKLLIVDDEQVVREGLEAILQRGFPELEIAQAKNGKLAIELAASFEPNLILMDIKMPGMDGLETIEQIGATFPEIKFIMITAYDTFEYARRALKLGVKDYLLKPSKAGEITATVKKVFAEIEAERQSREQSKQRDDKLERLLPVIETDMVTQLLFDYVHDVHLDETVRWLDVDPDSEKFALAVIIPDAAEHLYGAIRETIRRTGKGLVGALNGRQVPIIGFRRAGQSFRAQASDIARELLAVAGQELREQCFIGIGNPCSSLGRLRQSYQEALIATSNPYLPVKHRFYDDYASTASPGTGTLARQAEQRLFDQVRLGDWDRIREDILHAVHQYEQAGRDQLQAQQLILQRLWIAARMLTEMGVELEPPVYSSPVQDYRQLRHETSLMIEQMRSISDAYAQRIKPDTIGKIKQYITEHSHQDISLEGIAEQFGLSPFYISKLFKEQLGVNYIDFLTECRINRAKTLMGDPQRSLKEITYEVGYRDPNYFSKVFKKSCDVSPTEYRKALLGARE
ncbi:response regulator [Paenibacillus kandeliae]|uniref:response regulator n=1 Tax=Paenibacillus kandeliae TaxID=3231269 RepID=UPI00345A92E7